MKILEDIVKCDYCGRYLQYDEGDIFTKECCYGVGTYQGETYVGKFVECPNCHKHIEI